MTTAARPLARLLLGALLLVLVAAPAVTAAPIAHREVLPNGIVLLVAERPGVPIVAVRVFTRAGAATSTSSSAPSSRRASGRGAVVMRLSLTASGSAGQPA